MNEVSIIINGKRYNAIQDDGSNYCFICDLREECRKANDYSYGNATILCSYLIGEGYFKLNHLYNE